MPCQWKTEGGKRIRYQAVRAPNTTTNLGSFNLSNILSFLNFSFIMGSPSFTAEELKDATITLWLEEERGYFAEVRRHPSLPPVYLSIPREDADRLVARRPTAHFLANLFDWPEVPDQ